MSLSQDRRLRARGRSKAEMWSVLFRRNELMWSKRRWKYVMSDIELVEAMRGWFPGSVLNVAESRKSYNLRADRFGLVRSVKYFRTANGVLVRCPSVSGQGAKKRVYVTR